MQIDLLEHVYEVMVTDPGLIDLFPGGIVNVRYMWQEPEQAFPYITHVFRSTNVEDWGLAQGTWRISTWDQGPDATRALNIHSRIKTLFDRMFYCDIENISGLRIWWQGDAYVPEKEDRIWHNVNVFGIRYVDTQHISNVVDRTEGLLS